jgi:hypothetical protein
MYEFLRYEGYRDDAAVFKCTQRAFLEAIAHAEAGILNDITVNEDFDFAVITVPRDEYEFNVHSRYYLSFTDAGHICATFLLEEFDTDNFAGDEYISAHWRDVYEDIPDFFYNELDESVLDLLPADVHDFYERFVNYKYVYPQYEEVMSEADDDEYDEDGDITPEEDEFSE